MFLFGGTFFDGHGVDPGDLLTKAGGLNFELLIHHISRFRW